MVRRILAFQFLLITAMLGQQSGNDGSVARGAAIFGGKGACLDCHWVAGKGSRLGVDLTEIGETRKRDALEKVLLDPPTEVPLPNRMYRIVTNDGAVYSGKLLNQDTASLQILDSKEHLRSIPRSGVRDSGFAATPPMPSYRNKLSPEEITDVVAYLSQLKGVTK
jgi:cytochrome c oxidase cbb3-type subunit 3